MECTYPYPHSPAVCETCEVIALKDENSRLRAFIHRLAEKSADPATVLVARQVLDGHDVRTVK
jgi:hypothetical protein